MNDKTVKLIESLAKKLGTTSEYLWKVLVNQAKVEALVELFLGVLLIIAIVGLLKLDKYFRRTGKYDEYNCHFDVAMGFLAVITLVCTFVFIFSIPNIITGLLNPEYWAFQEVTNLLK